MNYKDLIKQISGTINASIVDLSVKRKRGTAPTQAFSDFLTHSEQGDWAEILFFNTFYQWLVEFMDVELMDAEGHLNMKINVNIDLFSHFNLY